MSATGAVPTVSACLCTRGVDTPYERTGRGPALLFLADSPVESSAARTLIVRLSARHRVFRPDLVPSVWGSTEAPAVAPERWLLDLVEGLGLDRPIVVVESWAASRLRSLLAEDRFGAWIEIPDSLSNALVAVIVRRVTASSS